MCDGVQAKLRRAAEIVDIVFAKWAAQAPSIVRAWSSWLTLIMH
jgi:hypothetical protein